MFPSTPPPPKGLQASIHACSPSSVSTSESYTTPIKAESTVFSVFSTPTTPHTPTTPPQAFCPSHPASRLSSTAAPTETAKSKAYYRLIRLDKLEIERRNEEGKCTYCSELGHSRRSCAAGRIMRKVPKRMLDARLRSGVCPLCGDPSADGHSKLTCPDKQTLQATLNAKRDMGYKTLGTVARNSTSTTRTPSTKLHEGTADSALYDSSRNMNKIMRRRMSQATTPTRARNNKARIGLATRPYLVPTKSVEVDLIDFGDTSNANSSTMSSTSSLNSSNGLTSSTSAASVDSTIGTTVGSPQTPPPKFAKFTSYSSFRGRCTAYDTKNRIKSGVNQGRTQNQKQKRDQKPKKNLLDMAATEVVWGGVSLPVAKLGLGQGHGNDHGLGMGLGLAFDMDMDVDDGAEYASQSWGSH